ncbi:MAG: yecA family protein [Reinekea sp.]|jgi:yecA family protein|uniref:UPF0149 family protein n=1 Tax=Reinekea sp. TaxID=1970455 RepID=UPI0039894217
MSNSRTARAQIKKLAYVSSNNPSFYFVHGFIVGLSINPELVQPSTWLPKLFGDLNIVDEQQFSDMDGVMWLSNEVMQQAMDFSIKLPAQCKLSPSDFEGSLKKDAPLPQWCIGLLASFELIDKRNLNTSQKDVLARALPLFAAFSSLDKLEKHLKPRSTHWQNIALEIRRNMIYEICDLLSILRFANNESPQHSEFPIAELENGEDHNELDEMIDFALHNDSVKA